MLKFSSRVRVSSRSRSLYQYRLNLGTFHHKCVILNFFHFNILSRKLVLLPLNIMIKEKLSLWLIFSQFITKGVWFRIQGGVVPDPRGYALGMYRTGTEFSSYRISMQIYTKQTVKMPD